MNPAKAVELIEKSGDVFVAAHVNPDGDAVGSVLAMGLALKKMGKTPFMYLESAVPDFLKFLPEVDGVSSRVEDFHRFDLAIILDCGELSRIGAAAEGASTIPNLINVDHHQFNRMFGSVNLVETARCATSAILMHLIKALSVPLDHDIAECLYTGIVTDTGGFRYGNTDMEAFALASELIEHGVAPDRVARELYLSMPLRRLHLLRNALASVEFLNDGEIGTMALTMDDFRQCGAVVSDSEGFIDYVRSVPGVRVAVLMKESPESTVTSVSLRSWGEVDVSAVARDFGGGGHTSASGFRLEGTIIENRERVLSVLGKSLNRVRG